MNKINSLFITSHIKNQGPNNQLRFLLTNLERDVSPIVCVLGCRELNYNTTEIEKVCKVIYLNLSWIEGVIISPFKVQTIIKKYHIDIVQSFGIRCDIISLFLNKVKKVVVVRNLTMINWSVKGVLGKLIGYTHLKIIKSFDAHFVSNNAIKLSTTFAELIYQIKEEKPTREFAKSYLADASSFYKTVDVFRKNAVSHV